METRKKLFTKKYYKKLEEKKYAEPTDRAKKAIQKADSDDRLQLKIRAKAKPKVLEASRIQNRKDLVRSMKKKEPFDSEKIEEKTVSQD